MTSIDTLTEKADLILDNLSNSTELISNTNYTNIFIHKNEIYEKYPNFDENYYKVKKEWNCNIQKALALGQLTEKEAGKLGWYGAIGESKIVPLPQVLYHVTTSKDNVIKYGLKTRDELSMESGSGLGGGASDTISFTESLKIAQNIKETLIEAQKVASGKYTLNDILNYAKLGTNTPRPFYEDIYKYYTVNDPYFFENLNNKKQVSSSFGLYTEEDYYNYRKEHNDSINWKPTGTPAIGSDDKPRFHYWIRDLSEDELREKIFDVYKKCLFWREHAGGKEDPLFFSSDVKALSKINPDQIAILQFKPKYNAHGYQMNALKEWRTYTGEAVNFVKEVI